MEDQIMKFGLLAVATGVALALGMSRRKRPSPAVGTDTWNAPAPKAPGTAPVTGTAPQEGAAKGA
jgi:hypothetical protein